MIPKPSPFDRKRADAELEARIRAAGADYERYLLADAYSHAAMRRRTRAEAAKLLKSNGKKDQRCLIR